MTDETGRDLLIARALERISVPDYEAEFWDRLQAQLVPGEVGRDAESAAPAAGEAWVPAERTVELATVVPLARRRRLAERRRSLLVLAAAAAVVVAVVAVSLRPGRDDAVRTASGTPTTDASTAPTTAPGSGSERHGTATSALVGHGTTPPTVALGTSSGAATVATPRDTSTPQGAFVAWATAIKADDTAAALALTGARTARYEDSLGATDRQRVTDWGSAWGDWASSAQRRIDVVELGQVSGQRVVGIVLRRPATGGKNANQYDALPMVLDADGWKVEPDGFDPAAEGRLELVSPSPGQDGLQAIPSTGLVQVAANGTGEYVLSVDLSEGTHIPVANAVDGTITWDPPDSALDPGDHLLLVAHVSDATIAVEADPFTVSG